jgi:hypothetical protein
MSRVSDSYFSFTSSFVSGVEDLVAPERPWQGAPDTVGAYGAEVSNHNTALLGMRDAARKAAVELDAQTAQTVTAARTNLQNLVADAEWAASEMWRAADGLKRYATELAALEPRFRDLVDQMDAARASYKQAADDLDWADTRTKNAEQRISGGDVAAEAEVTRAMHQAEGAEARMSEALHRRDELQETWDYWVAQRLDLNSRLVPCLTPAKAAQTFRGRSGLEDATEGWLRAGAAGEEAARLAGLAAADPYNAEAAAQFLELAKQYADDETFWLEFCKVGGAGDAIDAMTIRYNLPEDSGGFPDEAWLGFPNLIDILGRGLALAEPRMTEIELLTLGKDLARCEQLPAFADSTDGFLDESLRQTIVCGILGQSEHSPVLWRGILEAKTADELETGITGEEDEQLEWYLHVDPRDANRSREDILRTGRDGHNFEPERLAYTALQEVAKDPRQAQEFFSGPQADARARHWFNDRALTTEGIDAVTALFLAAAGPGGVALDERKAAWTASAMTNYGGQADSNIDALSDVAKVNMAAAFYPWFSDNYSDLDVRGAPGIRWGKDPLTGRERPMPLLDDASLARLFALSSSSPTGLDAWVILIEDKFAEDMDYAETLLSRPGSGTDLYNVAIDNAMNRYFATHGFLSGSRDSMGLQKEIADQAAKKQTIDTTLNLLVSAGMEFVPVPGAGTVIGMISDVTIGRLTEERANDAVRQYVDDSTDAAIDFRTALETSLWNEYGADIRKDWKAGNGARWEFDEGYNAAGGTVSRSAAGGGSK